MERYEITPKNFRILGRTLNIADTTWLGFSGSGIEFFTDSNRIEAEIESISGKPDDSEAAYIGIIINDNEDGMTKIRIERGRKNYLVYDNFGLARIKIRIIKLTESKRDKIGICAILSESGYIEPTEEKAKRILFIGDSLTAGYGTEVLTNTPYDAGYIHTTADDNVVKSYAYVTAKLLDADYMMVCHSGSGIISKYLDPGIDVPDRQDLIPELYPYVDRNTEQIVRIVLAAKGNRGVAWNTRKTAMAGAFAVAEGISVFDPESFIPDAIVLNVGTNDASFTKQVPSRVRFFEQRYAELIMALKADYPDAVILITYGMVEKSLSEACREVAFMTGSEYLELSLMDGRDGYGGGGHPSFNTHLKTATQVAAELLCLLGE